MKVLWAEDLSSNLSKIFVCVCQRSLHPNWHTQKKNVRFFSRFFRYIFCSVLLARNCVPPTKFSEKHKATEVAFNLKHCKQKCPI